MLKKKFSPACCCEKHLFGFEGAGKGGAIIGRIGVREMVAERRSVMGRSRVRKGCGAIGLAMMVLCGLAGVSWGGSPALYGSDGTFLGYVNGNRFDVNSTADPYGPYGSPYSNTSINNPYGQYGSPFSNNSATNPYAVSPPVMVTPPVSPMVPLMPSVP